MTGPGTEPVHGVTTEAGTYQRLRAHLAYLKLLDAAQALPAVLDQARDEGLGLTGALERLLGIEAAAVEARRQARRLRFASLPEPWTLADFVVLIGPTAPPRSLPGSERRLGSGPFVVSYGMGGGSPM